MRKINLKYSLHPKFRTHEVQDAKRANIKFGTLS